MPSFSFYEKLIALLDMILFIVSWYNIFLYIYYTAKSLYTFEYICGCFTIGSTGDHHWFWWDFCFVWLFLFYALKTIDFLFFFSFFSYFDMVLLVSRSGFSLAFKSLLCMLIYIFTFIWYYIRNSICPYLLLGVLVLSYWMHMAELTYPTWNNNFSWT